MTRLRAALPWLIPVAAIVLVLTPANAVAAARGPQAQGGPQMTFGQTSSPGGRTPTGIRSIPPTGQALSRALDQMTGLTASEVRAHDVCPAVAPGMARCAAEALVLQSSHRLVRPDALRGRVPPPPSSAVVAPRGTRG